jgi:hypothetical protein
MRGFVTIQTVAEFQQWQRDELAFIQEGAGAD